MPILAGGGRAGAMPHRVDLAIPRVRGFELDPTGRLDKFRHSKHPLEWSRPARERECCMTPDKP